MDHRGSQRRTNFYCQTIIILLGLITLRLWTLPVDILPAANAQVLDSGAVRIKILKASEHTNELLREIHETLKAPLRVEVLEEGEAPRRARKRPN